MTKSEWLTCSHTHILKEIHNYNAIKNIGSKVNALWHARLLQKFGGGDWVPQAKASTRGLRLLSSLETIVPRRNGGTREKGRAREKCWGAKQILQVTQVLIVLRSLGAEGGSTKLWGSSAPQVFLVAPSLLVKRKADLQRFRNES